MLTGLDPVDAAQLKQIVEGALMAADEPLSVDRLVRLFKPGELDPVDGRDRIRGVLRELGEEAEGRGYELKHVASGFRFQVRSELSVWIGRLWEEKPPRYSRALLETLALIAYRQPVTRGDIEKVRGVAVSQNILRTLLERDWVRVVGQRETPGRPNLYGTTRAFLDYFNLKRLEELPPLAEIRSMIEPLAEDGEKEEQGDSEGQPETEGQGENDAPGSEPDAAAVVPDTGEPERRLAEVVQLPTAGRASEAAREELHGE